MRPDPIQQVLLNPHSLAFLNDVDFTSPGYDASFSRYSEPEPAFHFAKAHARPQFYNSDGLLARLTCILLTFSFRQISKGGLGKSGLVSYFFSSSVKP